jgi:hypothetical protein
MEIERALLWAKVITFVGALLGIGNLIYNFGAPGRWDFWSIGLTGYFVAMAIYGLLLWRKARRRLTEFEAQNGHDAGRQV